MNRIAISLYSTSVKHDSLSPSSLAGCSQLRNNLPLLRSTKSGLPECLATFGFGQTWGISITSCLVTSLRNLLLSFSSHGAQEWLVIKMSVCCRLRLEWHACQHLLCTDFLLAFIKCLDRHSHVNSHLTHNLANVYCPWTLANGMLNMSSHLSPSPF